MEEQKQEIDFAGGKVSSSKIPGFKYIAYTFLVRLARPLRTGYRAQGR
jgi:hypothetical protein